MTTASTRTATAPSTTCQNCPRTGERATVRRRYARLDGRGSTYRNLCDGCASLSTMPFEEETSLMPTTTQPEQSPLLPVEQQPDYTEEQDAEEAPVGMAAEEQPSQAEEPATVSPLAIVRTDAQRALDNAVQDAARDLEDLIRIATRELETIRDGKLSPTDWIEQPAKRYATHLTEIAERGRLLQALDWVARQEAN